MDAAAWLRVLVTNDDGIASPGLWALAEAIGELGAEVVVVAPAADASGFAAAVGDIAPGAVLSIAPAAPPAGAGATAAWTVEGPPGRCVLAGVLGLVGRPPDLVVSGINAGANTGRFLQLHSGTLGGALTAGNSGLRAMAVSLDTPHDRSSNAEAFHWRTAALVAAELLAQLAGRPRRTVWNVNVPDVPRSAVQGIGEGSLGASRQTLAATPLGGGRFELDLVARPAGRDDAPATTRTDRALLDAGWVSITSVTTPGLVPVGDVALDG